MASKKKIGNFERKKTAVLLDITSSSVKLNFNFKKIPPV